MGTLLDLAKNLENRIVDLEKEINKTTVNIALLILADLVDHTPVDTSNALSNWQVSLINPVDNSINPYFAGRFGSTEVQSSRAAYDAGKRVLVGRKLGDKIYISNLADYIVYLNRGTSAQAPAGFVERAVLIGRNYLKNVKIVK